MLLRIILTVMLAFAVSGSAGAHTCYPVGGSPWKAAKYASRNASVVFEGKILSREFTSQHYVFHVHRVHKGALPVTTLVWSSFLLLTGETYLVYAGDGMDGQFLHSCSRVLPVAQAESDLRFLRGEEPHKEDLLPYLEGELFDLAERIAALEDGFLEAEVQRNAKAAAEVQDAEARDEDEEQEVESEEEEGTETEHQDAATMCGQVRPPVGYVVESVLVVAWRMALDGKREELGVNWLGDKGEFEIQVPPGRYFLSASGRGALSDDLVEYEGSYGKGSAPLEIQLASGQKLCSLEISLEVPQGKTLAGKLVVPDGKAQPQGLQVFLVRLGDELPLSFLRPYSGTAIRPIARDGSFALQNVPEGRYHIEVWFPNAEWRGWVVRPLRFEVTGDKADLVLRLEWQPYGY